jgi:hypothetical protein
MFYPPHKWNSGFCSWQESHIHSLMNVLRYCNLDESLNGEESLVCRSSLDLLFKTRELDYMSYIVLRMFENTEVLVFLVICQFHICIVTLFYIYMSTPSICFGCILAV